MENLEKAHIPPSANAKARGDPQSLATCSLIVRDVQDQAPWKQLRLLGTHRILCLDFGHMLFRMSRFKTASTALRGYRINTRSIGRKQAGLASSEG